jgi:hypothetical protein
MRRPDLAMVEGQILPEPYNVFASCNADSGSGRSNRPSLRQTGPVCRRGDLHICGCLVPAGKRLIMKGIFAILSADFITPRVT